MRKLYENIHIFHFQKRIFSAETVRGNTTYVNKLKLPHEIMGKNINWINSANSSSITEVTLICKPTCALTALHVLPSFDDLKNSLHSTLFSHENVKRWCFLFLSDYAQQQQLEGLPKCNLLNVLIKMYSFFVPKIFF